MSTINPGLGRLLAGGGGALLIVSLCLTWTDGPGGVTRTGWELLTMSDVYFLIVGLLGLAAAITGGWFGFFRPDLSLVATADIFAVVAATMLGWFLAFDFPEGASREPGAYLALIGAIAIACGAGDFKVKSVFPKLSERSNR